jgi:pyrroline-5-carboxylate reductase
LKFLDNLVLSHKVAGIGTRIYQKLSQKTDFGPRCGGAGFQTAGILGYVEDLETGPNSEIGPKDFFEIASTRIDQETEMLKKKTIGFIGAGNMAETLFSSLINADLAQPQQIRCADVRQDHLEGLSEKFGITTTTDNREVVQGADIVIIAVKPQIVAEIMEEIADSVDASKLVISIAAGVPLTAMESRMTGSARLVRAMPNVCVSVREGATAIAAGTHASKDDMKLAQTIFNAVGRCVVLPDEKLLDGVTGLSGSGPAYIFMIIDALADGAVKAGLARTEARELAAQTVMGAARMLLETGIHPGELKDMVTSPGGTTIAGIHALERGRLRATLMNAVEAATRRSGELGDIMIQNFRENQ